MGRRRNGTPSCKRRRKQSASPSPHIILHQNILPDNNAVEASEVAKIAEETSATREEKHEMKNALSPKTLEEHTQPIHHEPSHHEEERNDLNLQSCIDCVLDAEGVLEGNGSFALEENLEKNEHSPPTCYPEIQILKDVTINEILDQVSASILNNEINPINCTPTLQADPGIDADILLASSVEETQINPPTFHNNETSSPASSEHNKPNNSAENDKAPGKITRDKLVPNVQFLQPNINSCVAICNDEHLKSQLLDLNNDPRLIFLPENIPSFNGNEFFSEQAEGNDFGESTMDVQPKHLPCCSLVASLTNQNDALQREIHDLKNELASLSCQIFDLEVRCGKLESSNQQLLCAIREYADLGSREEILQCGEQIGQFTDFLQAMLEDIPAHTRSGNTACGAGPSFFHPL